MLKLVVTVIIKGKEGRKKKKKEGTGWLEIGEKCGQLSERKSLHLNKVYILFSVAYSSVYMNKINLRPDKIVFSGHFFCMLLSIWKYKFTYRWLWTMFNNFRFVLYAFTYTVMLSLLTKTLIAWMVQQLKTTKPMGQ